VANRTHPYTLYMPRKEMYARARLAIAFLTVGKACAEPSTCAAATVTKGYVRPPWTDSNLLQLATAAQPRSDSLGLANISTASSCPSQCRTLPSTGWPNRCGFSDCTSCEECRAPEAKAADPEPELPEVNWNAAADVKPQAQALLPQMKAAGPNRHPHPAPASPAPAEARRFTSGEVKAIGDPHLVNMYGQRFDIYRTGVHTLIRVPKKEAGRMLLKVSADVQQFGGACADLYFRAMNITGRWVLRKKGFFFVAQRKSKHYAAKWLNLGKMKLKVVWGHTNRGVKYLNFFVKHLAEVSNRFAIGGLLGEDDHSRVSTPKLECKRAVTL